MYKFEDSIPLRELVDSEIIQICFGAHDIVIRFDNSQSITIFSKLTFYSDNGWSVPFGNTAMLDLVGNRLTDFLIEDSSTAKAVSDTGIVIRFFDSPLNIESFSFALSTGEYVI
jgi:hypothetical protein